MRKIFLKIFTLLVCIQILTFLSGNSVWIFVFFIIILIIVTSLLLIVIIALFPALKTTFIAHGAKLFRRRSERGGRNLPFSTIKYSDIEISFLWKLNGGGIIFSYEFVNIITQKIGKVRHIFELCAGPGFIGFNLLANGLCDHLTLSDVNPQAIEAIKDTIKNNHLEDKVTVYQSDCLDSIPIGEKWDLVVGNLPWNIDTHKKKDLILEDKFGQIHKKFYRDVKNYLAPNGSIILIEGGEYTDFDRFKNMIEKNGLKTKKVSKMGSLLDAIKNGGQYKESSFPMAMLVQLCMLFRETYFIWSKNDA